MYIHHWYGNSSTDPDSASWDYSVISIYDNNLDADGYKNDTNIKHTTTHEVGHSIGLAHTTDTYNKSTSLMTAGDEADRYINSPSAYDKNQLKSIWGN
ncbi:hypothetical protein DCC85_05310 [Paenibacillus sp. CAA11]|uniref:M57 family metalloprotease n=1 Tax=Paenibacillus sp. CAA11 TaxID=1532905 RepID=UPI000D3C4E78|nr:M57 family metalloprotease [Paenibacillus sp. CAA11]AWB43694.1 hypothetical protein DCC85_05310 [Paenibacillus sp. CAA11]